MCDFCHYGPLGEQVTPATSGNAIKITLTPGSCTCWIYWGGYKPICPVHKEK